MITKKGIIEVLKMCGCNKDYRKDAMKDKTNFLLAIQDIIIKEIGKFKNRSDKLKVLKMKNAK